MDLKSLPLFTLEEVHQHNSRDDLHIVIHGKVYDATSYMADHPGGIDILLTVAGPDGDSASNLFEDVGHSPEAREKLATLQIGILAQTKTIAKSSVVSQLLAIFRARLLPVALLGIVVASAVMYFASEPSTDDGKNLVQI